MHMRYTHTYLSRLKFEVSATFACDHILSTWSHDQDTKLDTWGENKISLFALYHYYYYYTYTRVLLRLLLLLGKKNMGWFDLIPGVTFVQGVVTGDVSKLTTTERSTERSKYLISNQGIHSPPPPTTSCSWYKYTQPDLLLQGFSSTGDV